MCNDQGATWKGVEKHKHQRRWGYEMLSCGHDTTLQS